MEASPSTPEVPASSSPVTASARGVNPFRNLSGPTSIAESPVEVPALLVTEAESPETTQPLPGAEVPVRPPLRPRSVSAASQFSDASDVDDDCASVTDTLQEVGIAADKHPTDPQVKDAAAEALEDIEIYAFLRRTSRQLQEVQIGGPTAAADLPPLPVPHDFNYAAKDAHGKPVQRVDWPRFAYAYFVAQLERRCPASMLSPDKAEAFSLGRSRGSIERIYVLAPPQLVEAIFDGTLADIWRWKDKRRTGRYVAIYSVLWLLDLIPAFVVGFLLFLLVDRRLRPPDASQLHKEAEHRRQVGQQAAELSKQMSAAVSTEGALGMLARGALGSAGAAAMDRPHMLLHRSSSSPDDASPPSPGTAAKSKTPPRGFYSISRSMMTRYGPRAQMLLADLADLGEKVKKYASLLTLRRIPLM